MAENINIASFDFDTEKVYKNLIDLKNQMTILKNEISATQKGAKDIAKEFSATAAQMLKLEAAGEETSDEYQELKEKADKLSESLSVQNTLLDTAESQMSLLKAEYQATSGVVKALTDAENNLTTVFKTSEAAINRQITSIASARASNKELLTIRNQLNPAIAEESDLIQQLNEKLDSNNAFIKENASAYEQQKINIGNYSDSIEEALGNLNPFNGGLTGFIGRAQEAGGVGNLAATSFTQMAVAIKGATASAIAFIATPIGAVLAVVAGAVLLVMNAMNRSEESTNKVTRAIAPLTGWFNKLLEVLEPVGEFIIDVFVLAMEELEKSLYRAMDGLSIVLDALGASDWADGVQDFKNEVILAANASKELADAEAELEKNQRKSRLTQLEYQKEAEKFRQIRDNENLSIRDRISANEQLGAVLNKQLQAELKLAETALKVANLRIKSEGETKEALDAQYAALTEIADIEERITGQQSEQLTNRVSLEKEAADKAKEIRDKAEQEREKAFQRELKRMNEELDLWIAQQGERARTLKEQLEFERQVADDSIKILDYELKNKKISRTKYNTEVLKIQNELGKLTAELAAENAQFELDEWIRANKSILADENRLTDELILAEERRLNQEQALRIQYEQQRLADGIINETEYQQMVLGFTEETEKQKAEIAKRYAEQQRAEAVVMRQLEFEEDLLRLQEQGATRFELEQEQRDAQNQLELERLNEERELNIISEDEYQQRLNNIELRWNLENAQAIEEIEKVKQDSKVQLASQAFGLMSEILGKETAAGKAAAIAQT